MESHKPHFGQDIAASYDQNSRFIAPIHSNLLYLIHAIFQDLPADARLLSVGAGTGLEIVSLASVYPQFHFTAIEPAAEMLGVCRQKMEALGLLERCSLVKGYVGDLPDRAKFDAALCLLVTHHTPAAEKKKILDGIASRLKPNGYLVLAEISYDASSSQGADLLEKWQAMVRLSGASEDKVQRLPGAFKEHLSILPPSQTEDLLRSHGFEQPIPFFQSLLIRAWYGRKTV